MISLRKDLENAKASYRVMISLRNDELTASLTVDFGDIASIIVDYLDFPLYDPDGNEVDKYLLQAAYLRDLRSRERQLAERYSHWVSACFLAHEEKQRFKIKTECYNVDPLFSMFFNTSKADAI